MMLAEHLAVYIALGGIVALADMAHVAAGCVLTQAELYLLFVRIMLAWPTYVLEDIMLWMRDDDED